MLVFATSALAADEKPACTDPYEQGQALRKKGLLLRAREQLRLCTQGNCAAFIARDCVTWLEQVDKAIPSVVLSAKSGAGPEIIDVKVTMDGQPLAQKLDGRSIEVDPGDHLFVFETATGEKAEQRIVVREGEKEQRVAVTIGKPTPSPDVAPPPLNATTSASTTPAATGDGSVDTGTSSGSTQKTIGYVVGGAGIVGIGLGTFFGLRAGSEKSAANCDKDNFCDPSALSDARSSATISTISFIAGGALLAGGIVLILMAPSSATETKAMKRLEAVPMVGSSNGGLMLRGSW